MQPVYHVNISSNIMGIIMGHLHFDEAVDTNRRMRCKRSLHSLPRMCSWGILRTCVCFIGFYELVDVSQMRGYLSSFPRGCVYTLASFMNFKHCLSFIFERLVNWSVCYVALDSFVVYA